MPCPEVPNFDGRETRMKSSMMAGTAAVALLVATSAPAAAGSPACASRNNNTDKKLLECVTLDGVRTHQAAFQEHATKDVRELEIRVVQLAQVHVDTFGDRLRVAIQFAEQCGQSAK